MVQIDEGAVVRVCSAIGAIVRDASEIRRVLRQAELALAQSGIVEPVGTYAAAIVDQTIRYRPFRSRNSLAAWVSGMEALRVNSRHVSPKFDPLPRLQGLVDDFQKNRLALVSSVALIEAALSHPL